MLNVSVVSPSETTERLADYLVADPGVTNLVVRSGARRPQGDSVQFDLKRGYANPVLSRLRDLPVKIGARASTAFARMRAAETARSVRDKREEQPERHLSFGAGELAVGLIALGRRSRG